MRLVRKSLSLLITLQMHAPPECTERDMVSISSLCASVCVNGVPDPKIA
jgi:hypothetical protein